jgi:hypothetical protein
MTTRSEHSPLHNHQPRNDTLLLLKSRVGKPLYAVHFAAAALLLAFASARAAVSAAFCHCHRRCGAQTG